MLLFGVVFLVLVVLIACGQGYLRRLAFKEDDNTTVPVDLSK